MGAEFWLHLTSLSATHAEQVSNSESLPVSPANFGPRTGEPVLDSTAIPDLDRPAMVMLHSSHKAGKTKPQAESFKELVSRISQRCRLVPPKYADGTKVRTAFIWGRWTKYVDCSTHAPHLSSWEQANETGPRFCQKVYEESNY
jgi:hypothetical protein